MRIGMLGRGIVGRGLAAKLTELGHDVKVGSRDPSLSFADAAAHGEIVFNATAGTASLDALPKLPRRDSVLGGELACGSRFLRLCITMGAEPDRAALYCADHARIDQAARKFADFSTSQGLLTAVAALGVRERCLKTILV